MVFFGGFFLENKTQAMIGPMMFGPSMTYTNCQMYPKKASFFFLQYSATRLPLRFWQVHWECLRSFVSDPGSRPGRGGLWKLW